MHTPEVQMCQWSISTVSTLKHNSMLKMSWWQHVEGDVMPVMNYEGDVIDAH